MATRRRPVGEGPGVKLERYQVTAGTATRYLFFTGKGGVGKTSLSCATALKLAEAGRRVLLVSTDPASNLDEVLATPLTGQPTPIAEVPGLFALNINPVEAAAAYRDRIVGPMRGLLPESALRSMEEQLSGSCTVEIAAFDEFAGLIGNPESAREFDHIVFDTAPTGHTLRLMSLAKAWDQFLDNNTSGASCLGPLAGLAKQRAIYERTVQALADSTITTLLLVCRPQHAALREAERTAGELRALGVANQRLIINGLFETPCPDDVLAQAWQRRGQAALTDSRAFIERLQASQVPLRPMNILGRDGLRALLDESAPSPSTPSVTSDDPPAMESLDSWVNELSQLGHGVIMTMGKGGVGKTTVAAALAVALAQRGHTVHLSTTDPAAHVTQTLAGNVDGLTVGRIDPVAETADYSAEVQRTQGALLDAAGRALLEEDLRSPCTEEIAVFRAFAREVDRGTDRFVVLDTAPTGHTLLLLDASEAYNRELQRQSRSNLQPESVLRLLERLRDPAFTHVLLVTLPEATPVHEAAALQEDLRRARIEPFGWVINQSLLHCGTCDPLLRQREATELRYLHEVVDVHATRTAWLPWQAEEPTGPEALAQLAHSPLEPVILS